MSVPCNLCGETTFCGCLEAECRACNGEGTVEHPFQALHVSITAESPPDPVMVKCEECDGEGWIKCDRGGVGCRFSHCYCEAAWDAANERLHTEEPPLSADERYRRAWDERQALRSGRSL